MRRFAEGLFGICTILMGIQVANAGFVGLPRKLGDFAGRIAANAPTLPPIAFTQFCLRYANECKSARVTFRGGAVHLNAERWQDLNAVNKAVNISIIAERNQGGVANEKWLIGPSSGDCNDYAVTKRSELAKRGWPLRSLLLSEVVTPSGEGHLVLVVRTSQGDLVLDNLSDTVRPWTKPKYKWVRMQTPADPHVWASVARRSV